MKRDGVDKGVTLVAVRYAPCNDSHPSLQPLFSRKTTASTLFEVVSDVEKYSLFVPYVAKSHVLAPSECFPSELRSKVGFKPSLMMPPLPSLPQQRVYKKVSKISSTPPPSPPPLTFPIATASLRHSRQPWMWDSPSFQLFLTLTHPL